MFWQILRQVLLGIYALVSLAFIIVMAAYVTRKEGLSGIIGGGISSSQMGGAQKLSREEFFERITNFLAIAFFILSLIFTIIESGYW